MKPIRVNADYEVELFTGTKAPAGINQSLEFLAFFVSERPVFTLKKYEHTYLCHVEKITGRRPEIVVSGDYENWWGELKDLQLERKLNSKEFCTGFTGGKLVSDVSEIALNDDRIYLAKNPHGMSGQNIVSFRRNDTSQVAQSLKRFGSVIIEPLLDRVYDFSHYVFPDGTKICYENLVDQKFQYKGTLFTDLQSPHVESLRFYSEVSEGRWQQFLKDTETIICTYANAGAKQGFSIDSFLYREEGELFIRAMSEVNYRKTMGLIAWLLSKKFAEAGQWTLFILGRKKEKISFDQMKGDLKEVAENVILLSPGDTRFEMFFLKASNHEEGKKLFQRLRNLLPYTEFAVEIE